MVRVYPSEFIESGDLILSIQLNMRLGANAYSELHEAAQSICQPHLLWRPGTDTQKLWRSDHHGNAPGTGRGHVQPIATVQKVHTAWSIFRRGCCHRVHADRCLLPLKLVDGSDPGLRRQESGDRTYLGVVRCDDQQVLQGNVTLPTLLVDPRRPRL